MPILCSFAAVSILPERISSSAARMPMRRASRLHAPMPGNRLNRISGRPICALSSATMTSEVSAHSKPPPSASPCTSEIVVIVGQS